MLSVAIVNPINFTGTSFVIHKKIFSTLIIDGYFILWQWEENHSRQLKQRQQKHALHILGTFHVLLVLGFHRFSKEVNVLLLFFDL